MLLKQALNCYSVCRQGKKSKYPLINVTLLKFSHDIEFGLKIETHLPHERPSLEICALLVKANIAPPRTIMLNLRKTSKYYHMLSHCMSVVARSMGLRFELRLDRRSIFGLGCFSPGGKHNKKHPLAYVKYAHF